MIQGLQVEVKSEELLKILEERKKHHEEKSAIYLKEAATLESSLKRVNEDMEVGKVSSGTPVEQMRGKAREHEEKAGYFKFMIEHVIQNDMYRLTQDDLARLGITTRFF